MILFHSFILVVVGLAFEARIARNTKGTTICCRRGDEATHAMAQALDDPACRGVISFGIAGGLDHRHRSGTHLVASHVIAGNEAIPTHAPWSQILLSSCKTAVHAPIFGSDHVVVEPGEKRELFARTGAAAVDTESHITALMARERGLPFTCLRTIADPVHRRVPNAAIAGLREDGRGYPAGVLRALLRRPHETPALFAIARDTWRARRTLARAVTLAGDHLGLAPAHSPTALVQQIDPDAALGSAPAE